MSHSAKRADGGDSLQTQMKDQMDRSIIRNPMFREAIRMRRVQHKFNVRGGDAGNCDVASRRNHPLARGGIRIEMKRELLNGIRWKSGKLMRHFARDEIDS